MKIGRNAADATGKNKIFKKESDSLQLEDIIGIIQGKEGVSVEDMNNAIARAVSDKRKSVIDV